MPDNTAFLGGGREQLENIEYVPVPHLLLKKKIVWGYEDFQVPSLNLGELYWNKQYTFRLILHSKNQRIELLFTYMH